MDVKRGSEMKLRNLLFVVFIFIVLCGAVWRLSFEKSGLIYYPASGAELISLSAKIDSNGYPAKVKLINIGSGVSTPYYISSGVTFSDLITLEFENGAMLTPDSGIAVIVLGDAKAGDTQRIVSGQGTVAFKNWASVFWYGAVGDGSTDDSPGIQACSDTGVKTVFVPPEYTYAIGSGLTITAFEQTFTSGGRVTASLERARILYTGSGVPEWMLAIDVGSQSGFVWEGIELNGNDSTDLLGGIYILQGSWGCHINARVVDIQTAGAYGIRNEAYNNTWDECFVAGINYGTGVREGAGGKTVTTESWNRPYIRDCDTALAIFSSVLGITFDRLVTETCTVNYYQRANSVTMISPYFENWNRPNFDASEPYSSSDFGSLATTKITGDPGQPVDYAIYLDGDAELNIFGAQIGSINNTTYSKFVGVGTGSVLDWYGGRINDAAFTDRTCDEIASGRIYLHNPRQIDRETTKGTVSYFDDIDGSTKIEIADTNTVTTGDATYNDLTRLLGDRHYYTDFGGPNYGISYGIVTHSGQEATASTILDGNTDVDVADGGIYAADDAVSLYLDNDTWFYTTIASISTNTLTLDDAVTEDATSGATLNHWRWNESAEMVQYSQFSTTVTGSSSGTTILDGFRTFPEGVIEVMVTFETGNSTKGVYQLYIDNYAGTSPTVSTLVLYEQAAFTGDMTFGATSSSNFLTLTMTNANISDIDVRTKVTNVI